MTDKTIISAEEHQDLLNQWNAIVAASGSKTHGASIGHVAEMRRALVDVLEGVYPIELRAMTGLPMERCEEIYRLVSRLINS